MLDRRVQIRLDERRYRRLQSEARERKSSMAAVIRDAIDEVYPAGTSRRTAAARSVLGSTPMPVPSVEELREERESAQVDCAAPAAVSRGT
jgi:hypothetical protein